MYQKDKERLRTLWKRAHGKYPFL